MFWNKKLGWFGKQLDENIKALDEGDYSKISWVFCVFSEKHAPSKLLASKSLHDVLDKLQFDDIIRIDIQMRQTTSVEWSINWRRLRIKDFFTNTMNYNERRAVIVFASFNPNGFIREQAVRMMAECSGTLPYIILRLSDWVIQVRQAAVAAFNKRLRNLSDGELLSALPFAEKLKRSSRGSHEEYTLRLFNVLISPEYKEELLHGLQSSNVKIRRICFQALLDSPQLDIELALQRIKREPDPFLRKTTFERLRKLGQDMTQFSYAFLRDKYPANRALALRYLYDTKKKDIMHAAMEMLLDKNAAVRELSRKIVQESVNDFDIPLFYSKHIKSNTVAAILGLCETGQKPYAKTIEKFLNDSRIAVVRASMVALMRLDSSKYSSQILEMLGDSRTGVVKTAQQLILKYRIEDYERIQEIFQRTSFECSKTKCAIILFSAPKWQGLIYMLESLACESESVNKLTIQSIKRWLFRFNKSFTHATAQQKETIRRLINIYSHRIPVSIKKELLFVTA